ncbi:MAG: hypothetical protein NT159_19425 [Proteobacteria bacterium]|nr:hypothetical protein [Pseudomonadota bacterium]
MRNKQSNRVPGVGQMGLSSREPKSLPALAVERYPSPDDLAVSLNRQILSVVSIPHFMGMEQVHQQLQIAGIQLWEISRLG